MRADIIDRIERQLTIIASAITSQTTEEARREKMQEAILLISEFDDAPLREWALDRLVVLLRPARKEPIQ